MRTLIASLALVLVALTAPAASAAEHDVVAFGDSITYGVGTTDPVQHAYPAVAGVPSVGNGGQCLVTVGCIYPDTLLDTFRSEVHSLPRKPRTVVAEIGVNDLGHPSDAQFKHAYRRLVALGRSMGVRVVLATIPPTNRHWPYHGVMHEQRLRINQWIRSRGTYVDYARALEGRGQMLRAAYDGGDGLHPNNAGARAMAVALTKWIGGAR